MRTAGTKKKDTAPAPKTTPTPAQLQLYTEITTLLETARAKVLTAVNTTMTQTYYQIGKLIVENEQNGQTRAAYGKETLKNLSKQLTGKYGKGFSERNLELMRYFYLTYSPSISQTLSAKSSSPQISTTVSSKSTAPQIAQTLSAQSAPPQKHPQEDLNNRFKLSYSHYLFLMKIDNPERNGGHIK